MFLEHLTTLILPTVTCTEVLSSLCTSVEAEDKIRNEIRVLLLS